MFVQVVEHYQLKGEATAHIIPGEVYIDNLQITIKLAPHSEKAWKKSIKLKYRTAIIGAQKTTTHLNMKVCYSRTPPKSPITFTRMPRGEEPAMWCTGTIPMIQTTL